MSDETVGERWDRLAEAYLQPVVRPGETYELTTSVEMTDDGPVWVIVTMVGTGADEAKTYALAVRGTSRDACEGLLLGELSRLSKSLEEQPAGDATFFDAVMVAGRALNAAAKDEGG